MAFTCNKQSTASRGTIIARAQSFYRANRDLAKLTTEAAYVRLQLRDDGHDPRLTDSEIQTFSIRS